MNWLPYMDESDLVLTNFEDLICILHKIVLRKPLKSTSKYELSNYRNCYGYYVWQNILIEIMFMVEKVNKFRGAAKLDDNQFNDKQF